MSPTRCADYTPIPLKAPKLIADQRQLILSGGLRNDFHYTNSQDALESHVPVHEPIFQEYSHSSNYERSRNVALPHEEAAIAPYSPSTFSRAASLPPTDAMYSTDGGFRVSAAYDSGRSPSHRAFHPRDFQRHGAPDYQFTNERPNTLGLPYPGRYRGQPHRDHPTRPSSVEFVHTRSSPRRSYVQTANADASLTGDVLQRHLLPNGYDDANRTLQGAPDWGRPLFAAAQATMHRPKPQEQHRAISLPFRPVLQYPREADRYREPLHEEAITIATEVPETPEEEEEMNRLLRSYEC